MLWLSQRLVEVMGQLSNQYMTLPDSPKDGALPENSANSMSGRSDRKRPRRLIMADEVQLIKEYISGATLRDLASKFGINHRTAAAALNRSSIKSRHTRLSPTEVEEAISLYKSGLSLSAVARQIGGCANSIRNHLLKANVELRDSHGTTRRRAVQ